MTESYLYSREEKVAAVKRMIENGDKASRVASDIGFNTTFNKFST